MGNTSTKKWDSAREEEYQKEYYKANKNHISAYQKEWYAQNKEHVRQYNKDNHEKILKQQQEKHNANPEKRKERWQKWYQMNKTRSPKRRFTEAKHSAKKRKIEWTLTLEEYTALIAMPCYYCDNKLCEPVKRSIGLDRLDSSKGYEISNVVSCGYACNCIKHTFLTPEETKAAVQAILTLRNKNNALPSKS
jgi:hypothetical protein